MVHKLILPHRKESEETTSKLEKLVNKMDSGSCLDMVCGVGEHSCDRPACVRIQSFQKEELAKWFSDVTEKEKSEVQRVAECYASTTVNIATALGFFSRLCSLQSLEMLESEHQLVTVLSVESWPGVLQTVQKPIRGWKIGLEAEMGFPVTEAYSLPMNAKPSWCPHPHASLIVTSEGCGFGESERGAQTNLTSSKEIGGNDEQAGKASE